MIREEIKYFVDNRDCILVSMHGTYREVKRALRQCIEDIHKVVGQTASLDFHIAYCRNTITCKSKNGQIIFMVANRERYIGLRPDKVFLNSVSRDQYREVIMWARSIPGAII